VKPIVELTLRCPNFTPSVVLILISHVCLFIKGFDLQIGFGNVQDRLPSIKSLVNQDVIVLGEPDSLQLFTETVHEGWMKGIQR
jgi:hypothetical protein